MAVAFDKLGEIWAVAGAAGPVDVRIFVRGVTNYHFGLSTTPQRILTAGVALSELIVQNLDPTISIEIGNDRSLQFGQGVRIPPNALLSNGSIVPGASGTVALERFAKAALPNVRTPGRLVELTDYDRGVWLDDGTQFFSIGREIFNVKAFDAKGDGVTDDTAAINAAIAALPNSGGVIYFPQGTYLVTSGLVIGNGTNLAISGKNHIALVGAGPGGYNLTTPTNSGSVIRYNGAASGGALVQVNGPITGVLIDRLTLDCQGLIATGLQILHSQKSVYRELEIVNFTSQGIQQSSYTTTAVVSWGCNNNRFENIVMDCSNSNTIGFLVGAGHVAGGILDCAQNVYDGIYIRFYPPGANNIGIKLQFTDAGVWRNVLTVADFAGLFIQDPDDSHGWPSGILFQNCFLQGNVAANGTWVGSGILLLGFGTGDGEVVPKIAGVSGTLNTGESFGPSTSGAGGALNAIPFIRQRTLTIANLANAQLPWVAGNTPNCMALVMSVNDGGGFALVALRGANQATALGLDALGIFTVVAGTANKINVYWSAGNARYEIENRMGGSRDFVILFFSAV